jgi:hypothetical protein
VLFILNYKIDIFIFFYCTDFMRTKQKHFFWFCMLSMYELQRYIKNYQVRTYFFLKISQFSCQQKSWISIVYKFARSIKVLHNDDIK